MEISVKGATCVLLGVKGLNYLKFDSVDGSSRSQGGALSARNMTAHSEGLHTLGTQTNQQLQILGKKIEINKNK